MRQGLLIVAFISGVFFSCVSFAEEEEVKIFKSYFQKRASCGDYRDYEKVTKEFAVREKAAKIDSPEMEALPQSLKEGIFKMAKAAMFPLAELEIKQVERSGNTDGSTSTILYGRKGHADLHGKVTLRKEWGEWKVQEDALTTDAAP